MKKLTKSAIKYVMLLMLAMLLGSAVCFADTPPYTETITKCDLYVNNVKVEDAAHTIKGNIYLGVSTLEKYGLTDFMTFDSANKKVSFNAKDITMSLGDKETEDFIKNNAGEVYLPLKNFSGEDRISLGSVAKLCKINWRYEDGKVYIYPFKDAALMWKPAKTAPTEITIGSDLVLFDGSCVTVTGITGKNYKLMTSSGEEYYLPKEELKLSGSSISNFQRSFRAKDSFDTMINLAWVMTNSTVTDIAPKDPTGLDIMSPVWLRLDVNGEGSVSNICDYGYVELCHAEGMKVWICVNNNFDVKGGSRYSRTVLCNEKYNNKSIAQYLLYTLIYDADGINVDYESMTISDDSKDPKNGPCYKEFTEFMRTLYKYTTKLGITLSVDTMACSSYWQKFYDFKGLGECCDYVIPMTYGEHYAIAVGAGSTMSKNYYTNVTNNLIKLVGKEKVLMGVPLFTQLWKINRNADGSEGKIYDMFSITMKTSLKYVKDYNAEVVWDDAVGQYIATYVNEAKNYSRMWLEDTRSMAVKLKYAQDSGIAGTACWAYGQQTSDFLSVFDDVYKQGVAPEDIKSNVPGLEEGN